MMAKLCILEKIYNLSDVKVIEEANCNLAYLWFLGLNPDDKLPEASLLTKFRKHRLKDITIDGIMSEIVRQCVEKGIIKGTTLAIDSTHTEANCKKQVPERIMKHLSKKLFKDLREDHAGELPAGVDTEISPLQGFCRTGNRTVRKTQKLRDKGGEHPYLYSSLFPCQTGRKLKRNLSGNASKGDLSPFEGNCSAGG